MIITRRRFRYVVAVVLMLAAVGLIVVLPWFITQQQFNRSLAEHQGISDDAAAISAYTRIRTSMSDIDRAMFWLLLTPGRAGMRVEIAQASERIQTDLNFLHQRMGSDAQKLAQVAQWQTLVQTRRAEIDRILTQVDTGNLDLAKELFASTGSAMPFRELDEALVLQQEGLIAYHRDMIARQHQEFRHQANIVAALQLLLLGLILSWAIRQWRRRSRTQAETRVARRRADRILATVREPIVQLDGDLRIQVSNPAFQTLYVPDGGSVVGRPLAEVGGGIWNDAALLQKLNDVLTMNRELWDYEVEHDVQTSGRRTLLVNAWRMPAGEEDQGDALILTATDITARRGAERQIGELNSQLSARVREISEINSELESFNYSVSHDLRAPLRHIAAFSEKLGREVDAPPQSKARHYLNVIADSVVRMAVMIDELLSYSRLGRSRVKSEPVDVGALVEDIRSMLLESQGERSVAWRVAPLPMVRSDASLLRLVWQNLLGNAVKYTAKVEQAVIEVSYRLDSSGRRHLFSVIDNGAGFDMAYADKLFGVFQRLHSADEFPGTGIGLANVRRSLSRLGGEVWAESEPGQGARFHFSLPLAVTSAQRDSDLTDGD